MIDRIALFSNHKNAEAFLTAVFPHNTNCIIVSADGIFPKNAALAQRARLAIAKNNKLKLVVFNILALKDTQPATDRILLLDEILMQDFRNHPADRGVGLSLSAEKLAHLMEKFFTQWDRMHRIGNADFPYHNFKEFKKDLFDWRAELVTDA